MTISPGTRLGPYEVVSLLGAGGMGEVWRARDPRLAREVAIKVLPASFSTDPDRLRRFEQEARAAGILNHPNITAVYDVGEVDGMPYVVSELLDGETLRSVLAGGPLSARKAIGYSVQIAHGLAAAHEKGIVHRDLKPENLFVTKDGRVKILDFGLAKLIGSERSLDATGREQAAAAQHPMANIHPTALPTVTRSPGSTEPGIVLGTVAYMSPEQVRGEPADQRSDIFSLGTVSYEMLSGERPFRGDTAIETMNAILKEDPPKLSTTVRNLPPGLERIVEHCLEKDRDARFQSARDLAFNLESVSAASALAGFAPRRKRLSPAFAAVLILVAAGAFLAGSRIDLLSRRGAASVPSFQQLTFRRGYVLNARFSPDGRTIAYDGYWDGNPAQLFTFRTGGTESSPVDLMQGNLLSISRSDEIAALVRSLPVGAFAANGTLARMALGGGPPREILEQVQEADWSPDGQTLAIVRRVGDRSRIEYPAGRVLYATPGWVSHARISPDGSRIAFVDHPEYGNDSGSIALVDLKGRKSTLSRHWATALGLAWNPSSGEVWFTAAPEGVHRALYATTISGRERTILRVPGSLRLHDIFPDGRVLIAQEAVRGGMLAAASGQTKERDFSWQDFSFAVDLSADATMALICDQGTGAGSSSSSAYVRPIDGSPAVRLGDGVPFAFSPDAKWALALLPGEQRLVLLPTGAGEARHLSRGRIEKYETFGGWFADGTRILFHGREAGHGTRLYVQPIDGEPHAISPEGITPSEIGHDLSPDGRWAFARDPAGKAVLYPVDGGEPKTLPAVDPGEDPIAWDSPARAVYLIRPTSLPSLVYRVDLDSQQKVVWKDLTPSDPAGITFCAAALARDGKAYVYNFIRTLSDLYLVTGLR